MAGAIVRIPWVEELPDPGPDYERRLLTVVGETGEATVIYACLKGEDDAYSWIDLFGGGGAASADAQFSFSFDGNGVEIPDNQQDWQRVPFDFMPTGWTVTNDVSGSIVFDLWLDNLASYPPTVADTITASAKPTVSGATYAESSTLTGWDTTWLKGQVLKANVDSCTTVTRTTLTIHGLKTASTLAQLNFSFDGGGLELPDNQQDWQRVPFNFMPLGWVILNDVSGSIVIDLWLDDVANYPPTVADTITAAAKPTASSATHAISTALTGWDIAWSEGQIIKANIDSCTSVTHATLCVYGVKI
jgi:hypothetical protein